MRARLALAALLATIAAPAFAQSSVEQVGEMIVTDSVANGIPEDVATAVSACFTAVMTEAEADAILAADGLDAQQEATAAMAGFDEALACTATAIQ